jgi:endoglucanase
MFKKRFPKKSLSNSRKLLIIAILWLGSVGAFAAISRIHNNGSIFQKKVEADGPINVWWPTDNATVDNVQTFKAQVTDKDVSEYDMTWAVDGDHTNPMYDSSTEYPHKEAVVDLKDWTWHGNGPYKVTFKATDKSGGTIGETIVTIFTPAPAQGPTTVEAPASTTASVPATVAAVVSGVSGISNASAAEQPKLAVNPTTDVARNVSVWWPTENATVEGTFAAKAIVEGLSAESYYMYWQVDGDHLNDMYYNTTDVPHHEASINVSGWNWREDNHYTLTFVAKNAAGQVLAQKDVPIVVKNSNSKDSPTVTPTPTQKTSAPIQTETQVQTQPAQDQKQAQKTAAPVQLSSGNPLSGLKFYIDPNSNAKKQADAWRSSRPNDAYQMDKIAGNPAAIWLGGWNSNISSDVQSKVSAAKSQGAAPVFIAYNIPSRDCGSYSAGGVGGPDSYRSWIKSIADAIGSNTAIVVLEPDALASIDCLSSSQLQDRYTMISDAVSTLKSKGNIAVYIDAGHPNWVSADDMANRLNKAGISKADGFAINVSNFYTTDSNVSYGNSIASKTGKHFIVDTARNGVGPQGDQWCNPSGRALGTKPTTSTGSGSADAYLWLKTPGESDGNCNGGPSAGTWWPEYALGLAQRAAY